MPEESAGQVTAVQGFRPDYLALAKTGLNAVPVAEGDGYDQALVLLGRHRRENELHLAEALTRVKPGGLIVAAGTKKDGAPSFAKRVGSMVALEDQMSKHHGIVFWLLRPDVVDEAAVASLVPSPITTPEGLETAVGGFSEGKIDAGSQLLLKSLPEKLTASTGRVADFCAGWGYVALELARTRQMGALDLFEAHKRSLEAAERNFERLAPEAPAGFHWHDLVGEKVVGRYDAIVMNPPFHQSRSAEPDLGKAMIRAASGALKPGARLFMVANRGLPYEAVLKEHFAAHGETARDGTFKVLWARK
jgi:16S rRNA (guanine1207-N2)-methyltransferase